MLRSLPFHPNMNLNLSFSIFAISYIRRWTRLRQCQHSREFNAYRYRIYKWDFCCYNFHILSYVYVSVLYCVDPLSRYPVISPPGSFATKKPSRHQPTRRQIKQWRWISSSNESKVVEMKKLFKQSSLACLYACKLHVVGDVYMWYLFRCLGRATLNVRMFFFFVEWFSKQHKSRSCFLTFLLWLCSSLLHCLRSWLFVNLVFIYFGVV